MRFDAVIFDMDGTLIEAKEWHYLALNEALRIFGEEISLDDHLTAFDGLPTKKKLNMLSDQGRIPLHLHSIVGAVKQERTLRYIEKELFPTVRQLLMMQWLRSRGIKVSVATNSIKATSSAMLRRAGLFEFLDDLVTNEDVSEPKPSPEIYLVACERLRVLPNKALVFEDNKFGIESAKAAGCHVHEIQNVSELNTSLVASLVGSNDF